MYHCSTNLINESVVILLLLSLFETRTSRLAGLFSLRFIVSPVRVARVHPVLGNRMSAVPPPTKRRGRNSNDKTRSRGGGGGAVVVADQSDGPEVRKVQSFTKGLKYQPPVGLADNVDRWKPRLQRFLSPQMLPELYASYTAIGGQEILPIVCCETQNDHVRADAGSRAHVGLMQRVLQFTQHYVSLHDEARGMPGQRLFIQAQCKYAMHHNGDHGDHAQRKLVCTRTIRALLQHCKATALLDVLDSAIAEGHKTDDLSDALSLFLKKGIEWFDERTRALYDNRRTAVRGVDEDLAKRLHGQGIPMLAVDIGTRNYALCLGELVSLDAARTETYVTCEAETKEHLVERPHFRVLRWQLIDLFDGRIKVDYRGPSPTYRRLDDDANVTAPVPTRKRRRSDGRQ